MKLWQCKCGQEIETSSQVESQEVQCPVRGCKRIGCVNQICPVCEEVITEDELAGEETCECDACEMAVHTDCGGIGSVVGIETWGCNYCHKMD